jgi:hypothetical protein
MCAFNEIAEYFTSDPTSSPPEDRNIFHFLALATIQSRGVGFKSEVRTIGRFGRNAETIENQRDPTGIMARVLDYLCKETTYDESKQPPTPYLAQFLKGHKGIQRMLFTKDYTSKTPNDIIKSMNRTTSQCFISNIATADTSSSMLSFFGGKSRRSRKQKKRATKKSKKSRKTARKQ